MGSDGTTVSFDAACGSSAQLAENLLQHRDLVFPTLRSRATMTSEAVLASSTISTLPFLSFHVRDIALTPPRAHTYSDLFPREVGLRRQLMQFRRRGRSG